MSDSVRPHRWQPTRLPRPWDSPGKNTGVVCHFLLQCLKMKSESEVAQSCRALCDPMDCSLPGSSVPGIFQARVLEWGGCHCLLRIKCLPCVKGGGWYSENVEGLAGEEERPALPATAFLSAVCFCITWDLVEMLSLAPSDRILISRLHTPTSSQVRLKRCCSTEHSLCGKGAWSISSRGACKGEGGRKLGSGSPASKSWLHCLCKSGFSRDMEPIGWIDRKIQMFTATSISLCVYVSICA